MPTPITLTTVNFTYNIPDEMYGTTNTNNLTAEAVYEGPDRIWVFVDSETGKIISDLPDYTTQEDGADIPVPPGLAKIEIVAQDDPVVISMIRTSEFTVTNQNTVTETMPDGREFSYNEKPELTQCHDKDDLTYDFDAGAWKTLPWLSSPITWDDVIAARTGALVASDNRIAPDMPDDVKAPWLAYRTALRDLPADYGRGTENEVPAWKVRIPAAPDSV